MQNKTLFYQTTALTIRPLFWLILLPLIGCPNRLAKAQTLTTLYSFSGALNVNNGGYPYGGLAQDSHGNLYGTTEADGASGGGTFFKFSPLSDSLSTLQSGFGGPETPLVQSGNLFYGTTMAGGYYGYGSVFSVSSISPYTVSVLFNGFFQLESAPTGVVLGKDGNLYFDCSQGIYQLSPTSPYNLNQIHNWGSEGIATDRAGLLQGKDGNLYGTTVFGGNGHGTVFGVSPVSPYNFWIVHPFSGSDGNGADAPLVQGNDGNLYATTSGGGANGYGAVFRVSPVSPYTYTLLHSFSGADGSNPVAPLMQAGDGNFYGTTKSGGANGLGTVFMISPAPLYTLKTLHSFSGGDGANPCAGLLQSSLVALPGGVAYGTTESGGQYGSGTLFKLALPFNAIIEIQLAGANAVLTIDSLPGESYQLQYSLLLSPASWSNVAGALVNNCSGGLITLTDSGGASHPQRFYMVAMTP